MTIDNKVKEQTMHRSCLDLITLDYVGPIKFRFSRGHYRTEVVSYSKHTKESKRTMKLNLRQRRGVALI